MAGPAFLYDDDDDGGGFCDDINDDDLCVTSQSVTV